MGNDNLARLNYEAQERISAIVRNLRFNLDEAIEHRAKLALGLRELVASCEAYMAYHGDKFYGDGAVQPTGLHPAIARAKALLEELK